MVSTDMSSANDSTATSNDLQDNNGSFKDYINKKVIRVGSRKSEVCLRYKKNRINTTILVNAEVFY